MSISKKPTETSDSVNHNNIIRPSSIENIQTKVRNSVAGLILGIGILIAGCSDKPKNPPTPENFSEQIIKMSDAEKREIFYTPTPSHDIQNYQWKYMRGYFGKRFWPTKVQWKLITPWLKAHSQKYNLVKAKTKKDFAHLPSLDKNPKNFAYRFYKVGASDNGEKFGEKNDPDYIKMHKSGHKIINELQEEFAKILYTEANLDKKYTPTLTITSIGRDDEYVKKAKMRNASEHSAHKYGIAFDLRLSIKINPITLEISDMGTSQILAEKKTGKIVELTGKDKIIYELALRQALDKLRTEGKIFVNIEWNPPHYHIHVIPKANTKWIPSNKYFVNYPTYYKQIIK